MYRPEAVKEFTGADPAVTANEPSDMDQPKVSIVTPTWNREAFLPAIHACVRQQTYDNLEWIVLDDSNDASEELSTCKWDKLKYIHSEKRLSIGEKRNLLIAESTGDIIANFDDDDFYGPDYIRSRIESLTSSGKKLSLMSGFFVYHLNTGHFGYYRTRVKSGVGFCFNKQGVKLVDLGKVRIPYIHLCYGWSYIFYKDIWDDVKFSNMMIFEDREFVRQSMEKYGVHFHDSTRIEAIHCIHSLSSSNCFPQFLIPPFMISAESKPTDEHVGRLKAIVKSLDPGAAPVASSLPGVSP